VLSKRPVEREAGSGDNVLSADEPAIDWGGDKGEFVDAISVPSVSDNRHLELADKSSSRYGEICLKRQDMGDSLESRYALLLLFFLVFTLGCKLPMDFKILKPKLLLPGVARLNYYYYYFCTLGSKDPEG
jgi:hypothetical protein